MVEGGDSQTSTTIGGVPVPFGAPAPLSVFNGAPVPIDIGGATFAPGAVITRGAGGPLTAAPTLLSAKNSIFNRNAIGWNIRANFGFDLASNTAYGPLIGHFDINSDLGNGFDSPNGSATYVNTGYVTWAGITAGKAQSFFSFIGGGDNWNNFFSPDRERLQRTAPAGLHRLVRRRLHGDARCPKSRHCRRLRRRHQPEWRLLAGRS